MKILRLTQIKCRGLEDDETVELRVKFRGDPLGDSIKATGKWQELGLQHQGTFPADDFTGNLHLESPQGVSLFISLKSISFADRGKKKTQFKSVNPSITGGRVKPILKYEVEQVVPFSAPAPVLYLLRPVFFLIDLAVGLSITLFKAAGSLIRLILDPGNRLFVPSDDDEDDDDNTDQKPPEETIPQ